MGNAPSPGLLGGGSVVAVLAEFQIGPLGMTAMGKRSLWVWRDVSAHTAGLPIHFVSLLNSRHLTEGGPSGTCGVLVDCGVWWRFHRHRSASCNTVFLSLLLAGED